MKLPLLFSDLCVSLDSDVRHYRHAKAHTYTIRLKELLSLNEPTTSVTCKLSFAGSVEHEYCRTESESSDPPLQRLRDYGHASMYFVPSRKKCHAIKRDNCPGAVRSASLIARITSRWRSP